MRNFLFIFFILFSCNSINQDIGEISNNAIGELSSEFRSENSVLKEQIREQHRSVTESERDSTIINGYSSLVNEVMQTSDLVDSLIVKLEASPADVSKSHSFVKNLLIQSEMSDSLKRMFENSISLSRQIAQSEAKRMEIDSLAKNLLVPMQKDSDWFSELFESGDAFSATLILYGLQKELFTITIVAQSSVK